MCASFIRWHYYYYYYWRLEILAPHIVLYCYPMLIYFLCREPNSTEHTLRVSTVGTFAIGIQSFQIVLDLEYYIYYFYAYENDYLVRVPILERDRLTHTRSMVRQYEFTNKSAIDWFRSKSNHRIIAKKGMAAVDSNESRTNLLNGREFRSILRWMWCY